MEQGEEPSFDGGTVSGTVEKDAAGGLARKLTIGSNSSVSTVEEGKKELEVEGTLAA